MDEEKKVTEIDDAQVAEISGGDEMGIYDNHRIITAFGKCSNYSAGSNFFNKKVLAIGGTCGACEHMTYDDGWHVCGLPYK